MPPKCILGQWLDLHSEMNLYVDYIRFVSVVLAIITVPFLIKLAAENFGYYTKYKNSSVKNRHRVIIIIYGFLIVINIILGDA